MLRILIITKYDRSPYPTLLSMMNDNGVELISEHSSSISAFTSMTIARYVNKQQPSIVIVDSLPNAFAAVSARKIAKRPFKIICAPEPNSPIPSGIAQEVRQNIDAWIFSSQDQLEAYPSDLRRKVCIPRFEAIAEDIKAPIERTPKQLAWIGAIDGNTDRLIKAIEEIDKADKACRLVVCGTAKAQNVMPAVHRSRAISHSERIVWTGEEFDLWETIDKSCAIVKAGRDPEPTEITVCQKGRQLIEPLQIKEYADDDKISEPIGTTYEIANLIDEFKKICHEII